MTTTTTTTIENETEAKCEWKRNWNWNWELGTANCSVSNRLRSFSNTASGRKYLFCKSFLCRIFRHLLNYEFEKKKSLSLCVLYCCYTTLNVLITSLSSSSNCKLRRSIINLITSDDKLIQMQTKPLSYDLFCCKPYSSSFSVLSLSVYMLSIRVLGFLSGISALFCFLHLLLIRRVGALHVARCRSKR